MRLRARGHHLSYTIHYLGQVLSPLLLLVEVPLLTEVLVALAQHTAMW